MSQTGFPEHASGKTLLTDYGVQVKNAYECIPVQKQLFNDFHPVNEQDSKRTGAKNEADDNKLCDKPVVCCSHSCKQKCRRSYAPVFILSALFFCCLCVYSAHIDRKYSREVDDLRKEVKQLAQLCQSRGHKSGHSAAAENEASNAPSDAGAKKPASVSPVQISPSDVAPKDSEDDVLMYRKQADHRWLSDNPIDDEDDDDDDDSADGDVDKPNEAEGLLHRIRRSANAGTKKPKKKKRRGKGKRHCKKYKRCVDVNISKQCQKIIDCANNENQKSGPTVPPEPRALPVMAAPPFVPKAVHFFSDFWNGNRQLHFGREMPLKFLQAADWMSKVYANQSEQPMYGTNDGGFIVQESGLYLVYSSVMFHDLKPRHSHAVVVNGEKVFKCMDSVDYVDSDMPSDNKQAKYKSCTVTGVTHLAKGDRLEVQNLYENTEIDLSTDATYFGAILFSPGVVKPSRDGHS